ncbi:hypothetical protein LTR16_004426 [Cryomyces antarcticus]|uniref:Uncharacterized protein n=1 Tax=Cryomyces antarcticus TaxID=329879 RepID=A0ABR0KRT3_9PEZI|nr:hypothetical protein LTR16_004426 [Cryomyces antarcticus]
MHQAPTGRKVEEARVHEARIHEGAIAPENAAAGIARLGQVVQTRRIPLADLAPAHEAAVGRADGGEVGVQGGEGGRGQAEERAGGVVEGQELEADGARDGAQGGAVAELPAPGVGEVARVVDDERVDPVAQLAGQVREAEVERGCCVTVERDLCGHGVEAVGRASSVESLGRLVMMLGRVELYENETRVLQSHMREVAVAEAQLTRSSSYGKMCDEVMDSVNQAVTA